jgi:hypothetical protein
MCDKKINILITLVLFIILQAVKPIVVIYLYKEMTNFHPTIVNNYEIYSMVVEHIIHGSMKASYTVAFVISELFFLIAPFLLYRKLSSDSEIDK